MFKLLIALIFLSGCVEAPPESIGDTPNLELDAVDMALDADDPDMAQDAVDPDTSSDTGTDIGCVPEPEAKFCLRFGKDCGSVSVIDNCNGFRGANCGDCPVGEACGGGEFANVCAKGECLAETDEDFCLASSWDCGTYNGIDQCDDPRSANCGICSGNQECIEGSCECVPTPQSAQEFCAQRNKDCGQVTGTDSCGQARTADCGDCTGAESCGAGSPGIPNVCGCVPTLCQAGVCGTVPNGCDQMMDCGCNVDEVCLESTCCQPQTECQPGQCGLSPDGCGGNKNCGGCLVGSCHQGQCCTPQTVCQPGQCGLVSDGCGGNKNCGTCADGTCIAGSCQCDPEEDSVFCGRHGAECGNLTNIDNCGTQRVASCGTCPNNNQTCVNHQCVNPGGN